MNPVLLSIILIPILEIYLFIKIGSQIGAFNTILLIFLTAIIGIYYAKYEGLNTIRSGFMQIVKNETPAYEIISGAAIAFAAILLILPGFATDFLGFLLIFPITRKLIFGNLSNKFKKKDQVNEKKFIDGEIKLIVSTTVIEVGIDNPNANTIIVENSRLKYSRLCPRLVRPSSLTVELSLVIKIYLIQLLVCRR